MRKILLSLTIFLTVLSFGCVSTIRTPVINQKTGKIVTDSEGNPVYVEQTMTPDYGYYKTQQVISQNNARVYSHLLQALNNTNNSNNQNQPYITIVRTSPDSDKVETIRIPVVTNTSNNDLLFKLLVLKEVGSNLPKPTDVKYRENSGYKIAGKLIDATATIVGIGLIANSVENIVDSAAKNSGSNINLSDTTTSDGSVVNINTGNSNTQSFQSLYSNTSQ